VVVAVVVLVMVEGVVLEQGVGDMTVVVVVVAVLVVVW
jgi:hypothetical protein